MAIYAITGRPRHGKTLELARIASVLLKKKQRIFSNLKFNLGTGALKNLSDDIVGDFAKKEDRENVHKLLFYWTNIHEWEHFEKGTILVDEGQRYFNARQWDQLSEDTEIKLQQHGKDDLDIWTTTQHYSRIDVALRQLIEQYYVVETVFGNPDNLKPFLGFKLFRITGLDLEFIEDWYFMKKHPEMKIEIPYTKKLRLFKKKFAIIYDTRAKVGRSEPMPLVHRQRVCQICHKILVSHV